MGKLFEQPEVLVFIAAMLVALGSTVIGCVIWFVRLEGRLNYVEKAGEDRATAAVKIIDIIHDRIDNTKREYESALRDVLREMNDVKIELAELNGYLKKHNQPS